MNHSKVVAVEPDGFDAFYTVELRRLVGLAYVLTGDRSVAEDLANEALLVAHQKWDSISAYEAPGAWVRRVLINRTHSWKRRWLSERVALGKVGGMRELSVVNDYRDVERIWTQVRKLPKRQAQVIALHYLDDLSVEEIARVLECSIPTVKTHLQRGRTALANVLKEET